MLEKIRKCLLAIYVFIFIYQPNLSYIIKANGFILLGTITMIYVVVYISTRETILISQLKQKAVVLFIVGNILAAIYFAIRALVAGRELYELSELRIVQGCMPIVYIIGGLIINSEFIYMRYGNKDKIKFIIKIGLVQSCIAILMLVIPDLKNVALKIFNSSGARENYFVSLYRIYGICNGDYTFALQIIHGILSWISVLYAYYYNEKRYYLYSIILFSVTLLNGRFGLIIFAVCILLMIIIFAFRGKQPIKNIKFLLTITCLVVCVYGVVKNYMPNAQKMISAAISDYNGYQSGKKDTETGFFSDMVIYPEEFSKMLFGCRLSCVC